MPICSYLVIPEPGAKARVRRRLEMTDGCEVVEAENRDLIILLTDTDGLGEEEALRSSVEQMDGIEALLFTFGEVDPDTDLADPVRVGRSGRDAVRTRPEVDSIGRPGAGR